MGLLSWNGTQIVSGKVLGVVGDQRVAWLAGRVLWDGSMNMEYIIEAGHTMEQVENHQCDLVELADTIRQACNRAHYIMTAEYQRSAEMSEPFRYVRICKQSGEVVRDFFSK